METIKVQHQLKVSGFTEVAMFDPHAQYPMPVPSAEIFEEVGGTRRFQRFSDIQLLEPAEEPENTSWDEDDDDELEPEPMDPLLAYGYDEMVCRAEANLRFNEIAWADESGKPIPVGTTIQVIGYTGQVVYEEVIREQRTLCTLICGIADRCGTHARYLLNNLWGLVKSTNGEEPRENCTPTMYQCLPACADDAGIQAETIPVLVSGLPAEVRVQGFVTKKPLTRYLGPLVGSMTFEPGTEIVSAAISVQGDDEVYLCTFSEGQFQEAVQKIKKAVYGQYKVW